jgi:hypothetical protein
MPEFFRRANRHGGLYATIMRKITLEAATRAYSSSLQAVRRDMLLRCLGSRRKHTFSLDVSSVSVFPFRFALLLAQECTLEINPKLSP